MADVDPLAALVLAPGERVLWQGRPPLGAPWPGPAALVWAGLQGWFALLAIAAGVIVLSVLAGAFGAIEPWEAVLAMVQALWVSVFCGPTLIAIVLVVIAVSKRAGPFYISILLIGLAGPWFAIFWASLVAAHGWSGAVARLGSNSVGAVFLTVAVLVTVGLPLGRLALGVTRRLEIVHVITDRRVAELCGARLLWEAPRFDLRVERTWRSPGGHLVVGKGSVSHTLHVRDDPTRVVEHLDALAPPA